MRSFVRSHRLIMPYSPLDLTLAHFLFCEIRVQIHTTTTMMSSRRNLRRLATTEWFRINRIRNQSSQSVTVAAHPSLWQNINGENKDTSSNNKKNSRSIQRFGLARTKNFGIQSKVAGPSYNKVHVCGLCDSMIRFHLFKDEQDERSNELYWKLRWLETI